MLRERGVAGSYDSMAGSPILAAVGQLQFEVSSILCCLKIRNRDMIC